MKEQNMAYNLTYADMERKNHDMKSQIKEINTKLESIRVERNTIAKNSIEARVGWVCPSVFFSWRSVTFNCLVVNPTMSALMMESLGTEFKT